MSLVFPEVKVVAGHVDLIAGDEDPSMLVKHGIPSAGKLAPAGLSRWELVQRPAVNITKLHGLLRPLSTRKTPSNR